MADVSNHMHERQLEALRNYLRQDENQVTRRDSVQRHRDAMRGIWEFALSLTSGNIGGALDLCAEAVKSAGQEGEATIIDYWNRLNGVPSRAFGSDPNYVGVDKPQHFFACARIAYRYGIGAAVQAGFLWEARDWVKKLFGSRSGGWSDGDIHADNLGSALGYVLAKKYPEGRADLSDSVAVDIINTFLQSPSRNLQSNINRRMQSILPPNLHNEERDAGVETDFTIEPLLRYQVQKGDTLTKIVEKFGGDTNKWTVIYEMNKDVIGSDPDRILPGQVLVLPEAAQLGELGLRRMERGQTSPDEQPSLWAQVDKVLNEGVKTPEQPSLWAQVDEVLNAVVEDAAELPSPMGASR